MIQKLNIFYTFFITSVISFALVSCGNKKSTYTPTIQKKLNALNLAPGKEQDLFPLKVGNKWIYKAENQMRNKQETYSKESIFIFKITQVTDIAEGKKATLEITSNGEFQERQDWLINNKGIFQLSAGKASIAFSSPKLIIPFPIKNNQDFSWSGTGPSVNKSNIPIALKGKIIGSEEIDTELQRMIALATQTSESWSLDNKKGITVVSSWWTPKVGIARIRQIVATPDSTAILFLRLKSYTLL